MTTFAITRVRDEADIVESSMRRMLAQVDHVIVGEGGSQDGTREILEGLPVELVDDNAKNFEQRDVMTTYAAMAANQGADWVVVFDCDEVWHADEGRIADALAELDPNVLLAPARLLTHCVTSEDDPDDPDAFSRMKWRSVEMLPLPKVACRARHDLVIGHGNHSAHFRQVRRPASVENVLAARHFPYRSPEQFIKRVQIAWPMLRDSGLPESHGAHMWAYGRHYDEFGEDGLRDWFANGMFFENPAENPDLVWDPAPSA